MLTRPFKEDLRPLNILQTKENGLLGEVNHFLRQVRHTAKSTLRTAAPVPPTPIRLLRPGTGTTRRGGHVCHTQKTNRD